MGRIMCTLQFGRKDIKILRILNSLFPTIFFPGQLWNGIPLVLAYKCLWVYSLLMVYVAPVSRYSGDAFYLVGPRTTALNKWILRIGKNEYRPLSKNHSRSYDYFWKRTVHILRLHVFKHFLNLRKNIYYLAVTCAKTTYVNGTVSTYHSKTLKMVSPKVLEKNKRKKNKWLSF